jgi:hypothetical protein
MKPTRVARFLSLSLLLAAGCAQTPQILAAPPALNRSQLDVVMFRRDQGDGLAEIAVAIGSTRPAVRLAERLEKARLRGEARR